MKTSLILLYLKIASLKQHMIQTVSCWSKRNITIFAHGNQDSCIYVMPWVIKPIRRLEIRSIFCGISLNIFLGAIAVVSVGMRSAMEGCVLLMMMDGILQFDCIGPWSWQSCRRSTERAECSFPGDKNFSFITLRNQINFCTYHVHKFITFFLVRNFLSEFLS